MYSGLSSQPVNKRPSCSATSLTVPAPLNGVHDYSAHTSGIIHRDIKLAGAFFAGVGFRVAYPMPRVPRDKAA
jgi:hypothetical protein